MDEDGTRAMLGGVKRRIKRLRAASVALTITEHALRRAAFGRHLDAPPRALDAERTRWLDVIRAHGVVVVPGYWPRERCRRVIAGIDAFIAGRPEHTWTCEYGADERIYGFERVDAGARSFWADRGLFDLCEAYWGARVVNGFVSAGRLRAGGVNGGSGGLPWHKDGVTQQFKAILYLNDVGDAQGPFQYVRGTRSLGDKVRHIARSGAVFRQQRWDADQIARIEATAPGSLVTACGSAGTLVIAATAGLHRGKVITEGTRYSLTNYYVARSTLAPVAAYYNRSTVQADGAALTVAHLARCHPGEGGALRAAR